MLIFGAAIRFALTVIVLSQIGYIIPGLGHLTFGDAISAAFVIGALGYGIQVFLQPKPSAYVCGFAGFIVTGVVLWLGQSDVRHVHISLFAALLAAGAIGLINFGIPNSRLGS